MAAKAADVIRALAALHEAQATKIARAPTRVVPGYNADHGFAVTEDGRISYLGPAPGGGGGLARQGFSAWWDSSNTVTNNSWTTVNWNFVDYDDGYISGGTLPGSDFVLTGNSLWALSFRVQWPDTTSALRGIRMRATTGFTTYTVCQDLRTVGSGAADTYYAFTVLQPALGSEFTNGSCVIEAYQATGSSQDLVINFVGQQLIASPLT